MIDVKIEGSWPAAEVPGEEVFRDIADIMYRSVQQNFITGGRPVAWPPLKDGSGPSHLYQTGEMFENIQLEFDGTHASVFIDTSRVPYASIHNFGGTIQHPGSSKFQAFQYGGGWVYTWFTKPHLIGMPQRMFMMFQDEDREAITERYADAVFVEAQPL